LASEAGFERQLESVVRALSTAHKVLRLYPEASPIPRQSVESAVWALEHFFENGAPVLSLSVGREGFSAYGEPACRNLTGTEEFVDDLRSHGVAELNVSPGCDPPELLLFLCAVGRPAEELQAVGGLAAHLAGSGVESVRVADVRLTVLERVVPAADQDIDEFLRELAADPEKLTAWFAAASSADPRAFEEGLMELVRVSGPSGFLKMLEALSVAFVRQDSDAKDALLGLSMEQGPARDLTGAMFGLLPSGTITDSILDGSFGQNMLSLSAALTRLPLEQATAQVRADVQSRLPSLGRSPEQVDFLSHMMEVRERVEAEPALADADSTYRAVIAASTLSDTLVGQGLAATDEQRRHATASGVRTMLLLLDQQRDFGLYCASLDSLAGMVPLLIEEGTLELARRVMLELGRRQSIEAGPWPDLSRKLAEAQAAACGPRAMAALLAAVSSQKALLPLAADIVRNGGETAASTLVGEAVVMKQDGLDIAEQIVGRRLVDLLSHEALHAQWFQLAPVARWLARNSEPRAIQTLEALTRRRDGQSRREVVTGLAEAGGPTAERFLARALRDPSAEVAIVAARALGKCDSPRAAELLAARIAEIDIDHADFLMGRELIVALTHCSGEAADRALAGLASRRSIMKRGHFAEVQVLVNQARVQRARTGSVQ
jgi:hypothetical protein